MLKYIKNNPYQVLLLVLMTAFLADSIIGESYSHENLAAGFTALFFILVMWLHGIQRTLDEKSGDIHVYLTGNMDVDEVSEVIEKAIDKSRRLR